jgi:DNA-binding NtrC family response regulator
VLPPLRDRLDDIPLLVRHYVDRYCKELRRLPLGVSNEVLATYCKHTWPGNVRELKNAVERAALLAEDGNLAPFTGIEPAASPTSFIEEAFAQSLGERELRHLYARHAFERLGRNKLKTCEFLGIDFKTLQTRLLPSR